MSIGSKSGQLSLLPPAPKRRRMGRPRIHDAGIGHTRRPPVSAKLPLHVTLRMDAHVWNLRRRRSFRIVERALWAAGTRSDARICHYSVQGNHVHMLVEASDKRALSSAMRSLAIRLGLGLNKLMQKKGRVVAHRYHARALRTPTEVRNALGYVLNNRRKHAAEQQRALRADFVDPYSSEAPHDFTPPAPQTWLLACGWRRALRPGSPADSIGGKISATSRSPSRPASHSSE